MQRTFTHTLLITCILLLFSCSPSRFVTTVNTTNIAVTGNTIPLDSALVKKYSPFKNKLDTDMHRVISISQMQMEKNKPESELTNLLADILLEEGTAVAGKKCPECFPEISYFNYGGIRTFLPKGEVTVGKIFELMPFENEMVLILLDGARIQEFLDRVAEKGGDSVGGVRFVIRNSKATDIFISDIPFDREKSYWMVTNDYIAEGGDDMTMLTEQQKRFNSGLKIRDIIIRNLEEKHNRGETLKGNIEGRITNG